MKIELKNLFLILAFIFSIKASASGKNTGDSLKRLLPHITGIQKLNILEKLSDYYIDNNMDSSYFYLMLLKKNAVQSHNTGYESEACSSLGLWHFYKGQYFDAENYLLKAIQLQEANHDTARLAHSYNVLAGIYGVSGSYKKSIQILYKALKIYESKHNMKGLETIYNNWGYLYMKLNNYHKAMVYYKKALTLVKKDEPDNNKGFLYSNIGICYKEFGQYDSAFYFYKKALKEYKAHKTYNAIPMVYQSIGNLYGFRLGQPDSALAYFKKGIHLAEKYDSNSLIELYFSLGQLKEQQNKFPESRKAFGSSLEIAEKAGDLNGQKQAHYELFQVNKKTNRLPEAILHFQKYVIIKDSIDNKETRVSIARLEEKYKNEKNLIYIQKLKDKQIANQHLKTVMMLGLLFLLILLTFIVYGIFQRKKRNQLEKELLRSEKEKMDEELRYQNRQLASQALIMMQKNKLLQLLYNSLKEVPENPEDIPRYLNRIKHQIKRSIQSEKDWELFKLYFEQVNKTFFQKLEALSPKLTQHDLRLAALIKLGFNIKEAASVLNLSPNSIKGARYRLRRKLNLSNDKDLAHFIGSID